PGETLVLYARSEGVWWIQPFVKKPFTEIQPDSSWKNSIHLGTEYAAILVEPDYLPAPKTTELPSAGKGVVAVSRVQGIQSSTDLPAAPKTINFSGYEWTVYDQPNETGGTLNTFDPANISIDEKGFLHL